MNIKYFQVDAFAHKPFTGNPGGVCPLDEWIDDELMQNIAIENNLSETGFFVRNGDRFHIRWFTPGKEVDLCGHDTLACAWVIFNKLGWAKDTVLFDSRSGELSVKKDGDIYYLDFPAGKVSPAEDYPELTEGLGIKPLEVHQGSNILAVLKSEEDIINLEPDFAKLGAIETHGIIVTSESQDYDFVSRYFAPRLGINEDPVTGSTHTELIPFWSEKLGKNKLKAKQVSRRGGELFCENRGERAIIGGEAVLTIEGEIILE